MPDDLPAGPALDEAVCRALGIEARCEYWISNDGGKSLVHATDRLHAAAEFLLEMPVLREQGYAIVEREAWPRVSQDRGEMWRAVDRLLERGAVFSLEVDGMDRGPEPWVCVVWKGGRADVEGRGATAPEAVCRAALKALEAQGV